MSERNRGDSGEFSPEVDDSDLLDAVAEHTPAGTSEIAEAVGLSRQAADYRLRHLADEGRVNKKKIGASLAWSPAEN